MLALLNMVVIIAVLCLLGYFQASLLIWTLAGTVILGELFYFHLAPPFLTALLTVVFFSIAFIFNFRPLRRKWISQALLNYVGKILPPLSQTEKEALDAGDIFWEGELLRGNPQWKTLHEMPASQLTTEELLFLDNEVEHFCRMVNEWESQKQYDLTPEAWDYLRNNGFFSLVLPKEYGGKGFSALAHSTIVMKVATRSVSAAVTVMVPNSLGPAELLLHYGTKEQKDYYLPRFAQGQEIPCFGLTGPDAGSDAGAMHDTGIVCKGMHEGKEVLGIRLNFEKRYITLAPVSTIMGLAFKLYDPHQLLGGEKELGITLCLVPSKYPGVEIGKRHLPTISFFMNGPIRGKDVFVPLDAVIGGREYVGKGWRMLMECLGIGRSISLPALSAASGKYMYRMAGSYSRIREQFNLPICEFEGIQEALAHIGGSTYMLEATRLLTINAVDQGLKPSVASAITKYELTETLRRVANYAMDIVAGKGVINGPSNPFLSMYVTVPVAITVEGANILTRNLMIFGQGAIRCHPYLSQELETLSEPDPAIRLAKFDKLVIAHAGFHINNILGYYVVLTRAVWSRWMWKRSPLQYYYRQIERLSKILAIVTDNAFLILGGNLKRKESLSARLADVLSNLYMASAVLRYFEQNNKPVSDLPHLYWSLDLCLYNAQEALFEYWKNFPYALVGRIMKMMLFPFGRAYSLPSDKLRHQIAKSLVVPGEQRDRLTSHIFTNAKSSEAVARFEEAFRAVIEAEPAKQKLRSAIKQKQITTDSSFERTLAQAQEKNILTQDEVSLIQHAEKARQLVIRVDEFDPASLK